MEEHLTIAIVLISLFTGVTFILKSLIDGVSRTRVAKAQSEVMVKMIDRFGSSQELVSYLQSEAGKRFIETVPEGRNLPYQRILNSVQGGAVLTVLGGGIMGTQSFAGAYEARNAIMGVGLLVLTLGVGLLVSAACAWYMSRSWGLINGQPQQ